MAQYKKIALFSFIVVSAITWVWYNYIFSKSTRGFPILMYHAIDNNNSKYSVSPENFRQQLYKLYQAGYSTARLEDIITNYQQFKHKKVIVLRFDDSKKSHFRYIHNKAGELLLDPDCAVAILLDFYHKYPSFGKHALFCVIPKEEFHQPSLTKKKMAFLIDNTMEIANHSYYHKDCTEYTQEDIDNDFGQAMHYWDTRLGPLADHITMVALPYGHLPRQSQALERLKQFNYNGKLYKPLAILCAGRKYTSLCPEPGSKDFDPYQIPCLEVTNTNFDSILTLLANR